MRGSPYDVLGWNLQQAALQANPNNLFVVTNNYQVQTQTNCTVNPVERAVARRVLPFNLMTRPANIQTFTVPEKKQVFTSGLSFLPLNWQGITGRNISLVR